MPPGELLPDPTLRNHLPSEDLLRDLAQLPVVGGRGRRALNPGALQRGQRERHIEDTPTDPVDSERAANRHASLCTSQLGTRGGHTHTSGDTLPEGSPDVPV